MYTGSEMCLLCKKKNKTFWRKERTSRAEKNIYIEEKVFDYTVVSVWVSWIVAHSS